MSLFTGHFRFAVILTSGAKLRLNWPRCLSRSYFHRRLSNAHFSGNKRNVQPRQVFLFPRQSGGCQQRTRQDEDEIARGLASQRYHNNWTRTAFQFKRYEIEHEYHSSCSGISSTKTRTKVSPRRPPGAESQRAQTSHPRRVGEAIYAASKTREAPATLTLCSRLCCLLQSSEVSVTVGFYPRSFSLRFPPPLNVILFLIFCRGAVRFGARATRTPGR